MYGVKVWRGSGGALLSKLCSLQEKCVRLCTNSLLNDTQNLYISNRLLPFKEIYKYFNRVKIFPTIN